jgi:hypothetical protein
MNEGTRPGTRKPTPDDLFSPMGREMIRRSFTIDTEAELKATSEKILVLCMEKKLTWAQVFILGCELATI